MKQLFFVFINYLNLGRKSIQNYIFHLYLPYAIIRHYPQL
jgi:hypothetical protein